MNILFAKIEIVRLDNMGISVLQCNDFENRDLWGSLMKDKNDLKLLDVMCKWYIWAVVGLVIGNWLSDTLGSHIGLVLGSLIGWYIQKNYNKKDNG